MTMTTGHVGGAGLDTDTLLMMLDALGEFVGHELTPQRQLDLDHEDVCPEDLVRAMSDPNQLGVQLVFIPEAYGGMDGGAFDSYRICEVMGRHDIGLATAVFATFLGSDPILVGATDEQRQLWLRAIAEDGVVFAYGATEPDAGSDLGAMKTTAARIEEDGVVTGYRINGRKQWISNGSIADMITVLAMAPDGPSWFVVPSDTPGFAAAKPEDKHGIRLSNTAALFLDDVEVPADHLIGGVEGKGLVQAQQVFGYTRVMVAAFGLGGGWEALDRAIEYSLERQQGGAPLAEKQGFTHKLIVPHAVRLEAARSYIEESADKIDRGLGENGAMNTEGAIAKLMATEAGNAAADAAIQAHGGYGYTREYVVEKIKRDVRITTIYEGTSEIMEMTIARDRWQHHLKTSGAYYRDRAAATDVAPRPSPRRRRRQCRARRPGPRRCPGRLPARPTDPKPARAVPARRADQLCRMRRIVCAAGCRHAGRQPPREEPRPLRRSGAGGDEPRVRARGSAEGRARKVCAGWRARSTPIVPTSHPCWRRFRTTRFAPGRPGCSPTWTASPTCSTAEPADARPTTLPIHRSRERCLNPSRSRVPPSRWWASGRSCPMPSTPTRSGRTSPAVATRSARCPPERWDPALYFSPDHAEPDKTYSTIGGWVRDYPWDPIRWKLPIPPKVADQMDDGQRWAISAARSALIDAGWPDWTVDPDNVAVIIGNAIGGEKHYKTNLRIELPEVLRDLESSESFAALSGDQRQHIIDETRAHFLAHFDEVNEDTMPGELANVMAGRIANLFNFRGPNFTTDAACASGLAAMSVAVEGLVDHRFDAAITGGIDHNMGVSAFVKFCKIGALSATGTRPFDAGADGFVMGEGAALFVLKRLEDAERDGDKIYSVILGIGGSSDGKGKGITAPNPVGQRLAVQRAWDVAGEDPATVAAVEAHGTSTRVGDATELQSLTDVFGAAGATARSIALGSVKSNIGHLKAAAGAAGMFKMVRSLHDKVLPPSLQLQRSEPQRRLGHVAVRREQRIAGLAGAVVGRASGRRERVRLRRHELPRRPRGTRARTPQAGPAGVRRSVGRPACCGRVRRRSVRPADPTKPPPRGALVLGGRDDADLLAQVEAALADAQAGRAPAPARPDPAVGAAAVRLAVDFADAADLAAKLDEGRQGTHRRQSGDLPHAAPAGRVRRPRRGAEGGVPLHRSGFAVRQHARPAPRHRTDRRRDVPRGRRRDDAAARAPAVVVHLRRR